MTYMGIDVHKEESVFCLVDDKGAVVAEGRCATTRADLKDRLTRFLGAQVLIEASTDSEWVARHLESLGFQVIVGDPNYAPMYAFASKKVKTDKRDAQALAQACRTNMYRKAQRMSDEQRRARKLLDVRKMLVGTRTRYVTMMRATLRHAGSPVPSCGTDEFLAKVRAMTLSKEERELVTPLLKVLASVEAQLETLDDQVEKLCKKEPTIARLTTVPGVGLVTAAVFVAVVWNTDRFENAHKLEAYLGLVPGENSSGEHRQQTGITKQGPPYLRSLLVQCAHTVLTHRTAENAGLHDWALEIMRRSSRQVAVVALARKLAGLLFALWRDGTKFESQRHPPRVSAKAA